MEGETIKALLERIQCKMWEWMVKPSMLDFNGSFYKKRNTYRLEIKSCIENGINQN
jgi:hypothetical protein